MKTWMIGALAVALAAPIVRGQAQSPGTPAAQQPAAPSQPQRPRSQMPDLGRSTKPDDPVPLFDFASYYVGGPWAFEIDVPESVFGASGTLKGRTVFTRISDSFYEATTDAVGADGPYKTKETIAYRKDTRTIARHVSDSRGFSYMQLSTIGGDSGGYYNMLFESTPFQYQGKTVRIRETIRLASPIRYRDQMAISIDGGPFANYAIGWWEKDAASGANR